MPVFAFPAHGKLVRAGRERRQVERCLQHHDPVADRGQSGCRRRSWPSFRINHLNFVRARTETGLERDRDVETTSRQHKRLTQAFRLLPARNVSQIDFDARWVRCRPCAFHLVDWLDFTRVLGW